MTKNISAGLSMFIALAGSNAFAAAAATDCSNVEQFKEIDKKELTTLLKSKSQPVAVVDVNSADSYAEHHIPTAIHYGDFKNDDAFAASLPKDPNQMIVAYCGGLQCTAWQAAAKAACEHHYTNIRHFKPGISGWMDGKQTFFETKSAGKTAAAVTPASATSTQ